MNLLKQIRSFLYKIERKDKDGNVLDTFYQTIDFSANQNTKEKTVKIKGLKKGYYTVTEITDWSWKYELKFSSRMTIVEMLRIQHLIFTLETILLRIQEINLIME